MCLSPRAPSGNLLVLDALASIRRVTPQGHVTTLHEGFPAIGSQPCEQRPSDVAADAAAISTSPTWHFAPAADGSLYVLDGGNYTIRRIDPMGTSARRWAPPAARR